MTIPVPAASAAPALPPLPARVLGVLVSPRMVFRSVIAQPRWVGMLLLTVATATGTSAAFFSTEVGQQALLDQRVDLLEGFGQTVDDPVYSRLVAEIPSLAWQQLVILGLGIPLLTFVVAAASRLVYRTQAFPPVTLRHAMAVAAHAGAVLIARFLVLAPWNYARESLGSPLNLSALFPFLEEGTFLSSFLGTFDLFGIWWVLVLSTGLSVLYHRSTRSVAAMILTVYGCLAVVIAGAKSALGAP